MTDNHTELNGPDLVVGVDAESLRDGEKILGHAFGEAVLLARVANEFCAIGAMCSHYGGPLSEGVMEDGNIRCPWHHACFSLRTGEALRAPALNPVARYLVERRGDTVVVTAKEERDPLSSSYPVARNGSRPKQIVVIGAGAGGAAAAEMLRRCGYDGAVTMIDREPDSPYDRPNLSKDYLAGNAPEEWIPIRPTDFYAEHSVTVRRGEVTRLDTSARVVEMSNGDTISYDRLILATGAEPIHLGIPGDDLPHVHYLRSLEDSRSIIGAAKTSKRAVVVGASFIGLEVAASLRARDIDVHVVAPEKLPLERVLGTQLGTFIKSLHEEHGVVFHLARKPATIDAESVALDDGTRLAADLVVIGVGVRPRLALAERAGLAMDRGVRVNEYLETSVPDVYAVGDIARWPDPRSGAIRVEHWVVAQRMGQTAARNALGAHEKFVQVPFFWSAHYDVSINYVGHAEAWDRTVVDGDAAKHDIAVRYEHEGRVLAVATLFRDEESLKAEIALERAAE